jgi:hypothetical protein
VTTEEKTKFRTRVAWRSFRKEKLQTCENRCELCGTKYSGKRTKMLQVHHHDPDNYDDLTADKFSVLCSGCHEVVEKISKKLKAKNYTLINEEKWQGLLFEHLDYEAREILLENVRRTKERIE